MSQLRVSKVPVVFRRPFSVRGVEGTFPPGEYQFRIESPAFPGASDRESDRRKARLQLQLQPGCHRTRQVPRLPLQVAATEGGASHDALLKYAQGQRFIEDMLADPIIRLVMQADGVCETQVRRLYAALCLPQSPDDGHWTGKDCEDMAPHEGGEE